MINITLEELYVMQRAIQVKINRNKKPMIAILETNKETVILKNILIKINRDIIFTEQGLVGLVALDNE